MSHAEQSIWLGRQQMTTNCHTDSFVVSSDTVCVCVCIYACCDYKLTVTTKVCKCH